MTLEIRGETYYNTTEATQFLGISRATLNALVERGKLTRYRRGVSRAPIYKEIELQRLLEVEEDASEEN